MKRAAIFSAVVMQKHVVQKLEGVVDEVTAHGASVRPVAGLATVPARGRGTPIRDSAPAGETPPIPGTLPRR